ncbi:MAG: radical SAM family heme chaperone HemW [Lachnospiraceae bacterium]|nr:radical SAM family heme chaperone HemW [Lachnospiraceae bacterium]
MNDNNLGIYIHIPFCVKKCNYCDFNSASFSDEIKNRYIDALCEEIKFRSVCFSDRKIDTVFMGGGTPSILLPEQTGRIFDCLRSFFDIKDNAEITIETNPGTLDKDKLKAYRSFGVNRLSMGLQSFNDNELKVLGRIHNEKDFLDSFNNAREEGFKNINVDLMSAIPLQTLSSFESNLLKIKKLSPEHVSIYSLIIEENTPFYDMKLDLPTEEDEREMVHMIPDVLTGYSQYEISNYAKKGYECRHNIKYWKRDEYLGFGLSSASLIKDGCFGSKDLNFLFSHITANSKIKAVNTDIFDADSYNNDTDENNKTVNGHNKTANGNNKTASGHNKTTNGNNKTANEDNEYRFKNIPDINKYMDFYLNEKINDSSKDEFYLKKSEIFEEYEVLKQEDKISEYIILGLRMNEGINLAEFEKLFGKSIFEIYQNVINKHENEGLLYIDERNMKLTEKGRDLANYVWSDFI